jgi:flagellar biosynthetic protein FliQ
VETLSKDDFSFAIQVIRSGIFHILVVAAPALTTGLLVGLVVSIIQATTSIQEQTLTFVPKIAAILLAIFYFGPWMINVVVQFTENLFAAIPQMVR